MALSNTFTIKQVCSYFCTALLDDHDEPTEYYRCQCGTTRKQDPKTGYSNLFNHVLKRHPDYLTTMQLSGFNSGTLVTFIDQKSQTVYSWLVMIIECNLPFGFCENDTVTKYTVMKPMCVETLLKYADLVTKNVEATLSEVLPTKFGIIIDGCTFTSEHFVAVFAVFEHDGRAEKVLLAMAPIVDDTTADHTADSHVSFLESVLPFYKRDIRSIAYLVGDNCSVNTRLADLLNVPFIGCASHRLNLAVNLFLAEYEHQLDQIQQLMRKLRGLNKAAKLRKGTTLRPLLRQTTRWSSTYKMLERYFKLRPLLDEDDDEITELMPSRRHENRLKALLSELGDFQSATMKLQDDNLTLLDVRDIFDALIEEHSVVEKYLATDANIVKDVDFERACILALSGAVDELTNDQEQMLQPFETVPAITTPDTAHGRRQGFADTVLAARKKQRCAKKVFDGVRFIPPTSNTVERLFSVAKHTLSHHRQRMLPIHLETVLFLKMNRRFWDANTVAAIVNAK